MIIRKKFLGNKYIRQRDAMDCGPACLAMIAKHYGRNYELDYLRRECNLAKNGVSLKGISKAAEGIGFHTIGGKLTFQVLKEKAILPCVAHWNQNHFIVIYKMQAYKQGSIIHVVDPAIGFISYTEKEFCTHWISTQTSGEEKGVVILFTPTQSFYDQTGNLVLHKNRIIFLWRYLVQYKKFFLQLALGLIIGSCIQLIFPFLTQIIVDIGIK